MTRYEKLQYERLSNKKNKDTPVEKPKNPWWVRIINLLNILLVLLTFFVVISVFYINVKKTVPVVKPEIKSTVTINITTPKGNHQIDINDGLESFNLDKRKWTTEQIKNLLIVEDAAKFVNHPNPKRMGAHLMNESSANVILDGDIVNGAFKKSYGINQVKLDTVYYVKNKRPYLIKLYAPEVNELPKEDILDKLRKDAFFNSKIAAMMHMVLIDVCGDIDKASVAYNRGVCSPDAQGLDYLNKIKIHERLL